MNPAMTRLAPLTLAAALLTAAVAPAAEAPAGNYRLTVELGPGRWLIFVVGLDNRNGQWVGTYLGATEPFDPKTAVEAVAVAGDRLRFTIRFNAQDAATFDGKLPTTRGPIRGTLDLAGELFLCTLEPSR